MKVYEVGFLDRFGDPISKMVKANSPSSAKKIVVRQYAKSNTDLSLDQINDRIKDARILDSVSLSGTSKKKNKMAYKKRRSRAKRTVRKPLTKAEFSKLSKASKSALSRAVRKKTYRKRIY